MNAHQEIATVILAYLRERKPERVFPRYIADGIEPSAKLVSLAQGLFHSRVKRREGMSEEYAESLRPLARILEAADEAVATGKSPCAIAAQRKLAGDGIGEGWVALADSAIRKSERLI